MKLEALDMSGVVFEGCRPALGLWAEQQEVCAPSRTVHMHVPFDESSAPQSSLQDQAAQKQTKTSPHLLAALLIITCDSGYRLVD